MEKTLLVLIIALTGLVVWGVRNCGTVEAETQIYTPTETTNFSTPEYYTVVFDKAIYNCVLNSDGVFEGQLWIGCDNHSHGENITIDGNRGVVGKTVFKIKNDKIILNGKTYKINIVKEN